MKKIILFLILVLLPINVLAGVPTENRMKLGDISSVLPAKEMRD